MRSKTRTLAYLSYAFIALVWGTTYLAIKVAIQAYPAFLMAGTRQVAAGILMVPLAFRKRNSLAGVTRERLLKNAIVGFLMITLGNGVVSWAEHIVPSGVAALVCSAMPITVVVINLLGGGEAIKPRTLIGMALGFLGVATIFKSDVSALANRDYLFGILGLLLATFGWGSGSVLMKRWGNPDNPSLDVMLQVFFGGLFLLLLSPLFEDYSQIEWWQPAALWNWAYLVVFGSIGAMLAYQYALKHLPVSFVTSYAYINPLVAVLLGAFFGEAMNIWTGLAFVLIAGGVFLVNTRKKSTH